MTTATDARPPLTKKDFSSDQEVRWCPGCGDYAILNSVQQTFPKLGIPREKFVVVSGIGCSSRFPYYMNTYGFHTIHGRAPAVATGVKLSNPDLSVWVVTGDGDGLSIGAGHLMHAIRRNVGLKILLLNNRIYGLTKGQYSPTSEVGKRTKSTPFGSVDRPVNPMALALGAGATFVANAVDIFAKELQATLLDAAAHEGTAFVHIYQNCPIFNDHAFDHITDKAARKAESLHLRAGEPMLYGASREKALVWRGHTLVPVVLADEGLSEADAAVHDPADRVAAYELAHMEPPHGPVPLGVIRKVSAPVFEVEAIRQLGGTTGKQGAGDLDALLHAGDTWTVG